MSFCCFRTSKKKKRDDDFAYVSCKSRNNNTTILPPDLTKDNIPRTTIEELRSKLGNNRESGEEESLSAMIPESQRGVPHPPAPPLLSEAGLIIPKKLHNPVLDNTDRQNLHRELLFNQKMGKNVLNQKSELQKALEKQKMNQAKKEFENNMNGKTPELEKVIADRAKRLQESCATENEDDKGLSKEFLQARAKLKARAEMK